MNANRTQFEALIYESSILLVAKDFKGFLEHRDQKFECKLSAYSPEIKREMTWLNHGRAKMENLFNLQFQVASHRELPRSMLGHCPSWRGAPGSRPQTAR